jgi:hypothetical protein
MGKSFSSVRNKIDHLGLKEDKTVSTGSVSSSSKTSELKLPKDLPTVEEALMTLPVLCKWLVNMEIQEKTSKKN